jgi:hypothetical protein
MSRILVDTSDACGDLNLLTLDTYRLSAISKETSKGTVSLKPDQEYRAARIP